MTEKVYPNPLHKCEFCELEDVWPNVYWAPPYWTHSTCLIKAVEEGRKSPEHYR